MTPEILNSQNIKSDLNLNILNFNLGFRVSRFFFDVYKINTVSHGCSENMKSISRSLRSLVRYLVHTRNKFHISSQPCNILYLFTIYLPGIGLNTSGINVSTKV